MTNKTDIKAQPVYLNPEEKKDAKHEADNLGISVSGFFRMLLNLWLHRHEENKKE